MSDGQKKRKVLKNANQVLQHEEEVAEAKKWIELGRQAISEARVFFQKMRDKYEEEEKAAAQSVLHEYDDVVQGLGNLVQNMEDALTALQMVNEWIEQVKGAGNGDRRNTVGDVGE